MDGTLLDSRSRILPSSVDAIRAALDRDIIVFLATGKARPAAFTALAAVGLAGDGLVVGPRSPGIFLQGLTTHGMDGRVVAGDALPPEVVRAAFLYSNDRGIPLCGFLGEECITTKMTPELRVLHERYYEPLASVAPDIDAILAGPPVRKLLFMAPPEGVELDLKPHWGAALAGGRAEVMQAVPDMLEIVPRGWNKWRAMQALLAHAGLPASALAAVGDGSNDLELVANAGLGVAMANAVPAVKAAAAAVVASNDNGGVAEAIERLIL
jgi:hydroxymethylpyrimidine pyrophosphatase-like HAD family hydrolase